METTVAIFTFVGAMVGFITGIFVLAEKLLRGRPLAFFTVIGEGDNKEAVLRIRNVSKRDIFILSVKATPEVYFFVKDGGLKEVIRGAMGRLPYLILPSETSADLSLANHFENNVPKDLKAKRVRVRISWRRGNLMWFYQLPVYVLLDTELVKKFGLKEYKS